MNTVERKWMATVTSWPENEVYVRYYHNNFYTLHKWVRREGFNKSCIDFDYVVTKNPLYAK